MTAKQVLSAALVLLDNGRAHASPPLWTTFLAIDEPGLKVRPRDPRAVAWTSVGALCKVAPGYSASDPSVYADHTDAAWSAYLLLDEAALKQGHATTVEADRAGWAAVDAMFAHAIDLYEPPRRRLSAVGTGGQPRGVE